jgi:hypothetical protein
MVLPRKNKQIKIFPSLDKSVHKAGSICRMHILVNVARHQEQMPFETGNKLLIGFHRKLVVFSNSLKGFSPSAVVDRVVDRIPNPVNPPILD